MILKSPVRVLFSALFLLFALSVTDAWSQTVPTPAGNGDAAPAAAPAAPTKDPYGRETPQGMVVGLMNALAAADYERAVLYFATDSVPGVKSWAVLSGLDLARRFQEVLDHAGNVTTPAELSNDDSGNVKDGLAEDVERFGMVKTPTAEVPLLAKRVTRDGKTLWLVSDSTLRDIPALAASLAAASSTTPWIEMLPEGPVVAGAPLSHWLALIIAAGFAFAFAWTLTALRGPIERLVRRGGAETKLSRFIEASAGPVRILITLVTLGVIMQALGITVVARYRALFVIQLVSWFALSWLLWRWADAAGEVILGQMSRRGQLTAYSAVSFLSRVFKGMIVALLFAALLRAFGVNVTAGLAALGVGGLAIALGAQKLSENLIGSLTLTADGPTRMGDFCKVGDTLGTVEEIAMRATRIRTLDRTVLTVPNGELSALQIENFTQRDRFWFHPVLNLRYETSPDQMRHVLQSLRAMLTEHPKVDNATMRVRLISLGAHSLDIEVFAYVIAWDFVGFLEIQEELLLKCMEVVEASGTGFAFPSQTLYLGRDTGLDESKTRAAEEAVRLQREKKS
ncbi:MAG: mechanosensitive ion channel family protein [Pseudolabrys sp.]|nr:mechanosensitive ion channel family protein [Pseudolabrys sp.]